MYVYVVSKFIPYKAEIINLLNVEYVKIVKLGWISKLMYELSLWENLASH